MLLQPVLAGVVGSADLVVHYFPGSVFPLQQGQHVIIEKAIVDLLFIIGVKFRFPVIDVTAIGLHRVHLYEYPMVATLQRLNDEFCLYAYFFFYQLTQHIEDVGTVLFGDNAVRFMEYRLGIAGR